MYMIIKPYFLECLILGEWYFFPWIDTKNCWKCAEGVDRTDNSLHFKVRKSSFFLVDLRMFVVDFMLVQWGSNHSPFALGVSIIPS